MAGLVGVSVFGWWSAVELSLMLVGRVHSLQVLTTYHNNHKV